MEMPAKVRQCPRDPSRSQRIELVDLSPDRQTDRQIDRQNKYNTYNTFKAYKAYKTYKTYTVNNHIYWYVLFIYYWFWVFKPIHFRYICQTSKFDKNSPNSPRMSTLD